MASQKSSIIFWRFAALYCFFYFVECLFFGHAQWDLYLIFHFFCSFDHVGFDSTIMYEQFYQEFCKDVLKNFCENVFTIEQQNQSVKDYFLEMFAKMQKSSKNVTYIHKTTMNKLKISWQNIFNNRICMWCLRRKSENVFICGHAICDTCLRIFEKRLLEQKYQYKLENCFFLFFRFFGNNAKIFNSRNENFQYWRWKKSKCDVI